MRCGRLDARRPCRSCGAKSATFAGSKRVQRKYWVVAAVVALMVCAIVVAPCRSGEFMSMMLPVVIVGVLAC